MKMLAENFFNTLTDDMLVTPYGELLRRMKEKNITIPKKPSTKRK